MINGNISEIANSRTACPSVNESVIPQKSACGKLHHNVVCDCKRVIEIFPAVPFSNIRLGYPKVPSLIQRGGNEPDRS